MRSPPITKEILNIVRNIEKDIHIENRHDRIKSLVRENELLRGNQEETDRRLKALESYLEVKYVREAKYKKV